MARPPLLSPLSSDEGSLDDLFERNADMRLLERRHQEVGAPKSGGQARRVGGGFGAESIVAAGAGDIVMADAARLRVEIAAAPASGAIPGAVIGVAVDVSNDGTVPAPEAKLLLSLPHESEARPGSVRVDGGETERASLQHGAPDRALAAAASRKVTFQLQVLAGVSALILQPRLEAKGTPTASVPLGSRSSAARLRRSLRPPSRRCVRSTAREDEIDEVAVSEDELPMMPPVVRAPGLKAVAPADVVGRSRSRKKPSPPSAEPMPEPGRSRRHRRPRHRSSSGRPYRPAAQPRCRARATASQPGPRADRPPHDDLDLGLHPRRRRRRHRRLRCSRCGATPRRWAKRVVLQRLGKAPGPLSQPGPAESLNPDARDPRALIPSRPILRGSLPD